MRGGAGVFFGPRSPNQQTTVFGSNPPNAPTVITPSVSASTTVTPPINISTPIQIGPTSADLSTFTPANPLGLLIRTADFTNSRPGGSLPMESRHPVPGGARPGVGSGLCRGARNAAHHARQPQSNSVGARDGRLHHAGRPHVPECRQPGGDGLLDGQQPLQCAESARREAAGLRAQLPGELHLVEEPRERLGRQQRDAAERRHDESAGQLEPAQGEVVLGDGSATGVRHQRGLRTAVRQRQAVCQPQSGRRARILGGWQINGIFTKESGYPTDIRSGLVAATNQLFATFNVPDAVPGVSMYLPNRRTRRMVQSGGVHPAGTGAECQGHAADSLRRPGAARGPRTRDQQPRSSPCSATSPLRERAEPAVPRGGVQPVEHAGVLPAERGQSGADHRECELREADSASSATGRQFSSA